MHTLIKFWILNFESDVIYNLCMFSDKVFRKLCAKHSKISKRASELWEEVESGDV